MKSVAVASSLRGLFLSGSAALLIGALPNPALAQFCPGGTFTNGTCEIGGQGAVSTAALSSQALSEATQNVSQTGNDQATRVIRRRLDQEREAAAPATARRPVVRGDAKDPMVYKAAPVAVQYGPTYAYWAQGWGDYDRWKSGDYAVTRGGVGLGLLGPDPAIAQFTRKTTSFGGLGGADVTFRAWDSVYVFGVLAGYTDATVKFSGSSVGRAADNSTISNTKADISGASVGGYMTFASGQVSADLTVKIDFFDIDQTFNEVLFARATPVNVSGAASTSVTNYNFIGNLNYRVPVSTAFWWEPTVGIRTTRSDFANSATALGMADGSIVRLQGGVRVGSMWDGWYGTTVVTTLTGLVYSDVVVNGLTLASGGVTGGGFAVSPNEQGLVRGQGILSMNFIHSASTSTFIQGDIRGGEGYFGAGGKIGFRIGFN